MPEFYIRGLGEGLYPRSDGSQGADRDRPVTFAPSRFPPGVSRRAAAS
ncbi:protein of unassigned function [Methylobacterium oryzae CBMB20]|uniref:Protein of unassigned function n=1 Tax=Methylobacterium oryzae CBMB20 TaxID=693986 RepID=A0A089NRG3_9HYPH|nr:protein of unassigned function [Methylobacterium oryzae CBMB20]